MNRRDLFKSAAGLVLAAGAGLIVPEPRIWALGWWQDAVPYPDELLIWPNPGMYLSADHGWFDTGMTGFDKRFTGGTVNGVFIPVGTTAPVAGMVIGVEDVGRRIRVTMTREGA